MSRRLIHYLIALISAGVLASCEQPQQNIAPSPQSKSDHEVAHTSNVDEMQNRIAAGLDINARNRDGQTLLYTAVSGAHLAMVTLLLDAGANIDGPQSAAGRTALFFASFDGRHADLAASALLDEPDRNAAPFVSLLIERGADVNEQDRYKATALHAAVAGKHVHVVRILLENGANASLMDDRGRTPLDDAIELGLQDIVDVLCGHSPNLMPCANGNSVP